MKNLFLLIAICFVQNVLAKTKLDSLMMVQNPVSTSYFDDEFFCDACGCAAGNGSSGFESLLNPQFIGLKYFAQHYKAKENLFTNNLTQDQYFNTIQVWGKIPITKKLSVYASIPLQSHHKTTVNGDVKISGIGDANVMGIYQIINSKNTFHQLNGGFGAKIPTGKFNEKSALGTNPSFQLGTGSWDYQLVINYKYQKNKLALMFNSDYIVKTENKKRYQFGNQWNYAATGFHNIWKNENSIISGKLGLQGEIFASNKQFQENIPKTSGDALYGKFGFEASYKKWSLGSEIMLPIHSNLAHGDIEAKSRLGIFINFGL